MTLKIANLTILASILAVSSAAIAGPARVKPETKVETIVKEGVKPSLSANPAVSNSGSSFSKSGKIADIQAGASCQNIVGDAIKAMPNASLAQEVTKYAGILGDKVVTGCASGTPVDDQEALQNLGYTIILLGKAVESGQVKVDALTESNVAAGLQYAAKQQGKALDKATAVSNAAKLSQNGECKFFNVRAG